MSRKIKLGISNPLSNTAAAPNYLASLNFGAKSFTPNISAVTGASNSPQVVPTFSDDITNVVDGLKNTSNATVQEEGLIKSRSTLKDRRDAAFAKDPNSAKTARLNRRYSSYKEGTERRANEINKKDPQTGIGRAIKGVFGKNNFTNSAGEQVSRKEAVEERQQEELKKLKIKPNNTQANANATTSSSVTSGTGGSVTNIAPGLAKQQKTIQGQIGAATSNCGINQTYNTVTQKCE
jgi:hypothetical protein